MYQDYFKPCKVDSSFKFVVFASTAGGLRNCNGTAFASLKKYAAHFFNTDFVGTEPKEVPYAVTGENSKHMVLMEFVY